MSDSSFLFKQFIVHHDRCAMKVGTDGVLLGAWAPVDQAHTALDVGTGTGLVALQLAQRNPHLRVTAVEIDAPAAAQAAENVAGSPWPDRIEVVCADFNDFQPDGVFDLIVSNPPYFVDSLKCPDKSRMVARHTAELDFPALAKSASFLLNEEGMFSVVLPADAYTSFVSSCLREGLHLQRVLWVHTKPDIPAKRVLMTFVKQAVDETEQEHLTVEVSRHVYSPEYVSLLKDFYLKL